MSDNTKRELLWLLPTVLLSMVAMYFFSWQTGWELWPGQVWELQVHNRYHAMPFMPVAIYVFSLVFGAVYTVRLLISNFSVFKLNLVMIVTYGYLIYINHSLYNFLEAYSSLFYGIMGGAILMAAVTVIMMVIRLVQKKG